MMTRKIGIITTFKANNYGAELQAFALQNKLTKLGYDAWLIDYLFYKNRRYRPSKFSKPISQFSLRTKIKHYLLYRVIMPVIDVLGVLFVEEMAKRKKNFLSFFDNKAKLTRTYYSYEELYSEKFDFDVYCVGSDQVWNPNTATSIEPYFLTFAPDDALKISYASSFGVSSIHDIYLQDKYKKLLNNINVLSCREKQGVKLIKSLTGRDAVNVLDPTLLLKAKEWEDFASYECCPQKDKYILLYNIHESDTVLKLAYKLKAETGYPILKICKRAMLLKRDQDVRNIKSAGPADFIGLIRNAAYVITNSFHGTVFSIIFHKKFCSIMPKNADNNSRVEDFLKSIGLEDRLYYDGIKIDNIEIAKSPNYEVCDVNIEKRRLKSIDYLVNAISL